MSTGMVNPLQLALASKAKKIDHVAIAVLDLEQAIEYYTMLGFSLTDRMTTKGNHSGMNSAVMMAGPITFVLLEGTDKSSQITRFINRYGPGPQHIAIEVDNCEAVCAELEESGFQFSTNIIRGPELIQRFSSRCTNSGVMLEFVERNNEEGFSEHNVEDLFRQLEETGSY